jgi:hypothetical protein
LQQQEEEVEEQASHGIGIIRSCSGRRIKGQDERRGRRKCVNVVCSLMEMTG